MDSRWISTAAFSCLQRQRLDESAEVATSDQLLQFLTSTMEMLRRLTLDCINALPTGQVEPVDVECVADSGFVLFSCLFCKCGAFPTECARFLLSGPDAEIDVLPLTPIYNKRLFPIKLLINSDV